MKESNLRERAAAAAVAAVGIVLLQNDVMLRMVSNWRGYRSTYSRTNHELEEE